MFFYSFFIPELRGFLVDNQLIMIYIILFYHILTEFYIREKNC